MESFTATRQGALDFQVYPGSLNRALRIADALIKEFEKRQSDFLIVGRLAAQAPKADYLLRP